MIRGNFSYPIRLIRMECALLCGISLKLALKSNSLSLSRKIQMETHPRKFQNSSSRLGSNFFTSYFWKFNWWGTWIIKASPSNALLFCVGSGAPSELQSLLQNNKFQGTSHLLYLKCECAKILQRAFELRICSWLLINDYSVYSLVHTSFKLVV